MKIYVDIDGTLLSGKLNNKYEAFRSIVGTHIALWIYDRMYRKSDLAINTALVAILKQHIEQGDELVMWTNRGPHNRRMTRNNLGNDIWHMFSEYVFAKGSKTTTCKPVLDSIIYDDDMHSMMPGIVFVHVQW
jgi:hypothetical protein